CSARDEGGRAVDLSGAAGPHETAGTEAGEEAVADDDQASETSRRGLRTRRPGEREEGQDHERRKTSHAPALSTIGAGRRMAAYGRDRASSVATPAHAASPSPTPAGADLHHRPAERRMHRSVGRCVWRTLPKRSGTSSRRASSFR